MGANSGPYCTAVDPAAACLQYCPVVMAAGEVTYNFAFAEWNRITSEDVAEAAIAAANSTGTAAKAAADVALALVPAEAYIALEAGAYTRSHFSST